MKQEHPNSVIHILVKTTEAATRMTLVSSAPAKLVSVAITVKQRSTNAYQLPVRIMPHVSEVLLRVTHASASQDMQECDVNTFRMLISTRSRTFPCLL